MPQGWHWQNMGLGGSKAVVCRGWRWTSALVGSDQRGVSLGTREGQNDSRACPAGFKQMAHDGWQVFLRKRRRQKVCTVYKQQGAVPCLCMRLNVVQKVYSREEEEE
jgi:hypothetical protein